MMLRSERTKAQRVVLWATLLAIPLLAFALWVAQRPASLPPRYQELDLPVKGLH
jgi:hypothetical protein